MKKLNLYKLISILFILSIPMQPIVTNYIYYFLAFCVCFFTLLVFVKFSKNLEFTSYEKMEIFLIFFMILTLIFGGHLLEKCKYISGIIRYFVFISCLIRLVEFSIKNEKKISDKLELRKEVISFILNIFTIGTTIISIYVLIKEPSINGNYGRMGRVVYDNYGGYMTYSYNLIISVFWTLYMFMKKNSNNKKRKLYLMELIILIPCMFLNGTKKSLFALVIYFVGYIFLYNKIGIKKIIYLVVTIMVIAFSYKFITTNSYLNSIIGYRLNFFINSIVQKDSTTADFSTRERASMRKEAFNCFLSNPVFGIGISSFMYYFGDKYGTYKYAHNNYLELLADLGIIGFLIHYIWALKTIICLYKYKKFDLEFYNYLFLFMFCTLILEYGTVTFDQLQYILMFQLLSYSIPKKNKEGRLIC